jgi:ATP-dependent DNA helicase RecG
MQNHPNGVVLNFGIETETLEYKRSTSETEEALNDMVGILNKSGRGELYFGIRPDGEVIGQMVSEKTLRNFSQAVGNHIEPRIYPQIEKSLSTAKAASGFVSRATMLPIFLMGWPI